MLHEVQINIKIKQFSTVYSCNITGILVSFNLNDKGANKNMKIQNQNVKYLKTLFNFFCHK